MKFCNCLKKCFVEKRSFKRYFNDKRFKKALKDYSDFEYHVEIETDDNIDKFLESFEDNIKRYRKSLVWLQQECSVLEKLLERSVARTESHSSKAQNFLAILIALLTMLISIGGSYLAADISRISILVVLLLITIVLLFVKVGYGLLQLVIPSDKYELQNIFNDLNDQSSEIEFYQLKVAHAIISLNLRDCQNQDDGELLQCIYSTASLIPVVFAAILLIHIYPVVKTFLMGYLSLCSCCLCH